MLSKVTYTLAYSYGKLMTGVCSSIVFGLFLDDGGCVPLRSLESMSRMDRIIRM